MLTKKHDAAMKRMFRESEQFLIENVNPSNPVSSRELIERFGPRVWNDSELVESIVSMFLDEHFSDLLQQMGYARRGNKAGKGPETDLGGTPC